jgi:flagellin-specific chaperone FliS
MHRQDTVDAILIGLEKSSNIIDRCAVYESLYLQKDVEASRNLQKTILKLYTAILKYLVHAIVVSKGEFSFHTECPCEYN